MLAEAYDQKKDGYGMRRVLHIYPSASSYGELGCIFFALQGSPPKGYAVYVPVHNYLVIIDAFGKTKTYRDVYLNATEIKKYNQLAEKGCEE